ncbi:glycoside hydrolase [Paenibacillus hexagrammi]|uniref:Fibronectin type-III domain-containing protein n=1 Tax=Paenibacillus hexagrammi TaxID=2908839 RepID=A0ABY3SBU7_9BACL|nr:glycoside hydrolase [Paenibacillus sp. YPD9-1]UJF31474.1 hypothetical protein L0M14_16775 [Paenibacillus sp. YPD9-1]
MGLFKKSSTAMLSLFITLSGSQAAGVFSIPAYASETTPITIDMSHTYQTIDNFGASDAWSMDPIGENWSEENKEKVADLLFSTDKGIGLSAWRFNIGAGSSETDQLIISNPWRRAEAFKQTETSPYDWTKQAGQQWFLRAAKARGVGTLIGFVNSPPVWMTKNGHAQPDSSVGSTNLKPDYVDDFAAYLADVTKHFDEQGLHFDYISPINEPVWTWDGAGQEGNRYNNSDIKSVVNALYAALSDHGLTTKISAPEGVEITSLLNDEFYQKFTATLTSSQDNPTQYSGGANSMGVGKYREYIKDMLSDPAFAAKIDNMIGSHSYWSDFASAEQGDRLGYLHDLLWQNLMEVNPAARYWMTEYCILGDGGDVHGSGRDLGIDPALYMARTIHYDLVKANASAWQWWTAVSKEDYKDGLIYTDYKFPGDKQTIYESKMLWGLGNYSKFIRPGAKRVDLQGLADNDPTGLMGSAYVNEADNKLTNVYVNYSNEPQSVSIQVTHVPSGYQIFGLTPYVTSSTESLAEQPLITPDDQGVFTYIIPARSIVTLSGDYYPTDQAPAPTELTSLTSLNKAAEVKFAKASGADRYKITYGTNPNNLDQSVIVTATDYTLQGLTNNSTYYVRVSAMNDFGESEASPAQSVTPELKPPASIKAKALDGGFK